MANERNYIIDATGSDNLSKEGDDLKPTAKLTLSAYLSRLTKSADTGNSFPIEASISQVETSLRGNEGQPATFKPGGEDANPGFTRTFPRGVNSSEPAVSNFETLSNSGKVNGTSSLSDFLNKNNQIDGHNLYRNFKSSRQPGDPGVGDITGATSAPVPSGAPELQHRISEMLVNNNRFNPTPETSPYVENGRFTDPGVPIKQGSYGAYDANAARTTINELKKIASSILVRQTGHRSGDQDDPDSGSTLFPSAIQSGRRDLSSDGLRAISAFSAPNRPNLQGAEIRYDDLTGAPLESPKTSGAAFSYRNTFTDPISNSASSIRSLSEYLIAASVFTSIIEIVRKSKESNARQLKDSPLNKEERLRREERFYSALQNLGIPFTRYQTWKCLIKGISVFFGLPEDFSRNQPTIQIENFGDAATKVKNWFIQLEASGKLSEAILNSVFSSGYYATILRVARRDIERVLLDSNFGDAQRTGRGNQILEVLSNLNSYSSWNFYVTLLKIGDVALSIDAAEIVAQNNDSSPMNTVNLHRSRRPGQSSNSELTWSHRSSPALVLLNQKYVNAANALIGETKFNAASLHQKIGFSGTKDEKSLYYGNLGRGGSARGSKDNKAITTNRYSKEDVDSIERELESEYCPFYFHDLRNNEVIGFQAFLTDLKDSYSVSYAETSGYGRIDKVKIYQDTTRTINVSWVLVATNVEDFDSMWWSVNKLVSMIYPQFSMGKTVKAGGKSFVMPFSQIPTASPVIRLRVGDVIRSNYSKFNLARIFGLSEIKPANQELTQNPANIASSPFNISASADIDENIKQQQASFDNDLAKRFSSELTQISDTKVGFLPGDLIWGKAILRSGVYMAQSTGIGIIVNPVLNRFGEPKNTFKLNPPPAGSINVFEDFDTTIFKDSEVTILERAELGEEIKYLVQLKTPEKEIDVNTPEQKSNHYLTYTVSQSDLVPFRPEVQLTPRQIQILESQQKTVTDEINDFFDGRENAIVRSFEAAGGKGLAGVITSFDMDWNEAQWDMGNTGRRAPTLIKCSISFSPIHDIAPGLDNNGMMRAINYPVGEISKTLSDPQAD